MMTIVLRWHLGDDDIWAITPFGDDDILDEVYILAVISFGRWWYLGDYDI